MSNKPEYDIAEPTRTTIDRLFRELIDGNNRPTDKYSMEKDDVYAQCEKLKAEFENSEPYKSLHQKYKALYRQCWKRQMAFRAEAMNVRNQYLANGLTPKVKKLVNSLIAKYKKIHDPHVFVRSIK